METFVSVVIMLAVLYGVYRYIKYAKAKRAAKGGGGSRPEPGDQHQN